MWSEVGFRRASGTVAVAVGFFSINASAGWKPTTSESRLSFDKRYRSETISNEHGALTTTLVFFAERYPTINIFKPHDGPMIEKEDFKGRAWAVINMSCEE